MSSNIARDRLQSASTPLASVDEAPVKHFHLKETLIDPVPVARCRRVHDYAPGVFEWAARAHHQGLERSRTARGGVHQVVGDQGLSVLGRRQALPNTLRSIVPVQRHRSGCATRLLGGKRLRLRAVSCASQRPGRHRGRSRRRSRGDLPGVDAGRRSRSEPTDQEHSSPHRAARLAVPLWHWTTSI